MVVILILFLCPESFVHSHRHQNTLTLPSFTLSSLTHPHTHPLSTRWKHFPTLPLLQCAKSPQGGSTFQITNQPCKTTNLISVNLSFSVWFVFCLYHFSIFTNKMKQQSFIRSCRTVWAQLFFQHRWPSMKLSELPVYQLLVALVTFLNVLTINWNQYIHEPQIVFQNDATWASVTLFSYWVNL